MSYTEVSFNRVNTCLLDNLALIICYTYGSTYSNLADLCDESVLHRIEGVLGVCFTEFRVMLLQSEVSGLTSSPIVLNLSSEVVDTFVVDLSNLAVSKLDEALGCGDLGFKLSDET